MHSLSEILHGAEKPQSHQPAGIILPIHLLMVGWIFTFQCSIRSKTVVDISEYIASAILGQQCLLLTLCHQNVVVLNGGRRDEDPGGNLTITLGAESFFCVWKQCKTINGFFMFVIWLFCHTIHIKKFISLLKKNVTCLILLLGSEIQIQNFIFLLCQDVTFLLLLFCNKI